MNYADFPPQIVELYERQIALMGRVGASSLYRPPDVVTPIPVSSTAAPLSLRFRRPGSVIALYGQEQRGTVASFATTELRLQIGGQDDLVTDGQVGTFAPLLALCGPNANWFPLLRRATPGVDWTFIWRNVDTVNTATPVALLAFIADADLPRGR